MPQGAEGTGGERVPASPLAAPAGRAGDGDAPVRTTAAQVHGAAPAATPPWPVYVVAPAGVLPDAFAAPLSAVARDVSVFASADELVARAEALGPGCLLCPDAGVVAELVRKGCPFPIIVVIAAGDVRAAVLAMKAGAVDALVLPVQCEELEEALRVAQAEAARPGRSIRAQEEARRRIARLTRRERQVLEGMVQGEGNKAIALALGISRRTVEVHRAKVMEKLLCRSLSETVRLALRAGL